MNNQKTKVYKFPRPAWLVFLLKLTSRTNPSEVRQLFIIIRIVISVFTIGLIGYTLDRLMQSLQQKSLKAER